MGAALPLIESFNPNMFHPSRLYRASALSVLLCLSACGGAAIVRSSDPGELTPIGKGTLAIAVSHRHPQMLVSKHERGAFSQPKTSDDERRVAYARSVALEAMLARELPLQLKARLAPYANQDGHPDHALLLVVESIKVDTDGSVVLTVTARLAARGAEPAWLRTVVVSASRFGSDSGIAHDFTDAILAQLKASALVS